MTFGLLTSKIDVYREKHSFFRHLQGDEVIEIENEAKRHNGVVSGFLQFDGKFASPVVVGVCFENEQDMLNFKEEFKDKYVIQTKNSLEPGISQEIIF